MKNLTQVSSQHTHYQKVAKAIKFLVEHRVSRPSLKELADELEISEYHLQRIFTSWAGISPKQFLHFMSKEYAKQILRQTSVLEAAWASGLSGSSRLHDLLITHEGITPGEYKREGEGLTISYGVHSSMFGFCFIACTARGLCKLAFFDQEQEQTQLLRALKEEWRQATIVEDEVGTYDSFIKIFPKDKTSTSSIHLILKGSPFRLLVWEALLNIPEGSFLSYKQVACMINSPLAARAVASAVACNDLAYLIPCHRVIRESGVLGGYRWGLERKAAMLGYEASKID